MRIWERAEWTAQRSVSLLLAVVVLLFLNGCAGWSNGVTAYRIGDHKMEKEHDPTEANKWYARAMEEALTASHKGDTDAQVVVGKLYRGGKGVPQDLTEAAKWFQKAADQGNGTAIILLKQVNAELQEAEARKVREQQEAEALTLRKQQEEEAAREAEKLEEKRRAELAEEARQERQALTLRAQEAEKKGDYDAAMQIWQKLSRQDEYNRVRDVRDKASAARAAEASKTKAIEDFLMGFSAQGQQWIDLFEALENQWKFNERFGAPPVTKNHRNMVYSRIPQLQQQLSACHTKIFGREITKADILQYRQQDKAMAMVLATNDLVKRSPPRVPQNTKALNSAPDNEMGIQLAYFDVIKDLDSKFNLRMGTDKNWCDNLRRAFE